MFGGAWRVWRGMEAAASTWCAVTPRDTPASGPGSTALFPDVPGSTALFPDVPWPTALFPDVPGPSALFPDVPGPTALFQDVPGSTALFPDVPGPSALFPHVPGPTAMFPSLTGWRDPTRAWRVCFAVFFPRLVTLAAGRPGPSARAGNSDGLSSHCY